MQSFYLNYREHKIHCLRFGQGSKLLVALHGFGDRARLFAILEEALSEQYTVVAFDLPFHGQTNWEDHTFTKSDLLSIIRQIMDREGQERLCLMGYSFGARLAQAMLPQMLDKLDKLYLLAPDGIQTKGMPMAVRTPMWVRHFLYRILKRPAWFLFLLNWGRRFNLVPPLILHFLTFNLTRPERFQRTFGCWIALDSFYLRRRRIKAIWRDSGLPVDIYFGTKDEMIRYKTVKKMVEGVPNVRIFRMNAGHRLIGEDLRERMRRTKASS
ncbi:MAG: alpha/beta fold hydrolase [Lewinellaceae bacterium]|nr:alpha/beta fold hydrolase [Saprospiraceae bacterium]MCB9334137.1 alpha/beta fold hydrolase [Lewinellaceae bacterium]